MPASDSNLYAAFQAKDARFDGRFFVGISSTGIYCRPVCRARRPKAEHCSFYPTAAQAEQAGYRPCLLCRPELAPGASVTDAANTLAQRAAGLLEAHCAGGESLDELAARLGCTGRHLRRVFAAQFGVTPVQYLQTCRLLLAKSLLTDTGLSVVEVAMAAGFGSLRRFNDLFQTRYRLSPTALRKQAAGGGQGQRDALTLTLGYRPPYRWEAMLEFLARRRIPGVEAVRDGEYRRTVRLPGPEAVPACGWVGVGHRPEKNALRVTVSESLLPVLPQVLARVRRLFDLCCDPAAIDETLSRMNALRPGLCVPGTRLPGSFDGFETAVRAVLGQQVSVKAAGTLAARLVQSLGTPVQTGVDGLTHAFPSPEAILALDGSVEGRLGPLGIIGTRARTILELARAVTRGALALDGSARPEEEIDALLALPGIGSWTANYIAMRAVGWPDAFLETDAGIRRALPKHTPDELLRLARSWKPWRSYAVMNLWNSLEIKEV